WGSALVPRAVTEVGAEGRLVAKNFRCAAFRPLFEGVLDELDGRLDGNAAISLDPATSKPQLRGSLELRDGLVHVPARGGEFTGVRARATLAPDGSLRVDQLWARGVGGEVRGNGVMHFDGLVPTSAEASLSIPRGSAIDLSIQGQPIGEVSGDFR